MKTEILSSFLSSLVENSLVDSFLFDPETGKGAVVSGKRTYPFSLKEKGFVVSGKSPLEMYCPNPEAALVRALSTRVLGVTNAKFADKVYSSVSCFPKKIRSDSIVFGTANGKEFVQSSSNTRVTLGLYDILYSRNADSSILMMPELLPSGSDVVSIASQKVKDCFVTIKSEFLSSYATTASETALIASGDIRKAIGINQSLEDYSKVGDRAPTNAQLVDNSSEFFLQNTEAGYLLSCKLSLDTELTYHLEENVKPAFSLVQSSVIAANSNVAELEEGVCFTGEHRQAIQSMRLSAKPVIQSTTLSFNETSSLANRVSNYWGVPISSDKVKTVVWSY